jgi:CubicO group peptidase (beta-lactamase class C family)
MHQLKKGLYTLILVILGPFSYANNGQLAFAYPIINSNIKIDGTLDEWPTNIPIYSIEKVFDGGKSPKIENFSASFRVLHDPSEKVVYIALEIQDDIHITRDDLQSEWSQQDSVILYIDTTHSIKGSAAQLFTTIGQRSFTNDSQNSWDPKAKDLNPGIVEVASRRLKNKTTYEWKVKVGSEYAINKTLGLDFLIADQDEPNGNSKLYIWGEGTGKSASPNRIGDLLLLESNVSLGKLKGSLSGDFTSNDNSWVNRVHITNINNPDLRVHAPVNKYGEYESVLPAGEYRISNARPTIGNAWSGLKVLSENHSVTAYISANKTFNPKDLLVEEIPLPLLLQEKGALFSYSKVHEQEMDEVIKTYMTHFKIPGASIALIKDGKVVYDKVFGVKNAYTGDAVTSSTLFEGASTTKTVFAFAVNRLAQQGLIDLDKPLYQYLPFEAIAHDDRYKKITARHVLSHQTGFPNWAWMNSDNKMDIKFYPGIKYGYSGEAYEYLGRVVAHITKKTIEEVIMNEVQAPFGFTTDVYFSDNDDVRERVSHGHYASLAAPINTPSYIGVAHSMQTNASAFTQFMLGLIHKKGLSELGYAEMLEPQVAVNRDVENGDSPYPRRYSLGFDMTNSPFGLAYGHGGNNGDFTCLYQIYQDHDLGFVIFTNSNNGTAMYKQMQQYLIYGKAFTKS